MAVDQETLRRRRRAREQMARRSRGFGPVAPPTPEPHLEPEPEPAPTGWRDEVLSLSGLNVLAGIWLIIAPWVLGYPASDPRWNDVVFGGIVGLLALIRISGAYRESWLSVINAIVGVWLFVSAWAIDQSSTAAANDIILGVIVFVLAVGSAAATPHARRGSAAA
jgi:SPW repeat